MYSKINMIPRFASRVEIWNFYDSIVSQFPEETEPPRP